MLLFWKHYKPFSSAESNRYSSAPGRWGAGKRAGAVASRGVGGGGGSGESRVCIPARLAQDGTRFAKVEREEWVERTFVLTWTGLLSMEMRHDIHSEREEGVCS